MLNLIYYGLWQLSNVLQYNTKIHLKQSSRNLENQIVISLLRYMQMTKTY